MLLLLPAPASASVNLRALLSEPQRVKVEATAAAAAAVLACLVCALCLCAAYYTVFTGISSSSSSTRPREAATRALRPLPLRLSVARIHTHTQCYWNCNHSALAAPPHRRPRASLSFTQRQTERARDTHTELLTCFRARAPTPADEFGGQN